MPAPVWICCRQEESWPFSISFSCQIISFSPILVHELLYLWGGIRGRGPSHRAHFDKWTWSLSLTCIQNVQLGASAFILGGTLGPVADQSLPFLQQRSMDFCSSGSSLDLGNAATPSASCPCEHSSWGQPRWLNTDFLLWESHIWPERSLHRFALQAR